MLWLVVILAACQPPPSAAPAATTVDVEAQARGLEAGLSEALQLWRTAHYPEAQQALQRAYTTHFEPLEPALEAVDPERRLALEYAFGRLGWMLRRDGDDSEVAASVSALLEETRKATSALPHRPD